MAQANLQGAYISLAAAPVVDGRCLGLALCAMGLSVLRMAGCIGDVQLHDLDELIKGKAMPEGTFPLKDEDIPF